MAHSPDESIIVLLDWFSGHLTEEVAECIHSKGHVLLLHGGGTTPFTQINDTHLHAELAKLLLDFENTAAVNKRRALGEGHQENAVCKALRPRQHGAMFMDGN